MLKNVLLVLAMGMVLAVSLCSLRHKGAYGATLRPMPYPEAVYFANDLEYVPCTYADTPDWLCSWVPLPRPDPRKTAAK